MGKIPHQDVPVEHQIEKMLGEIKPQPTARLSNIMAEAPWVQSVPAEKIRYFRSWKAARKYVWGTVAFILMLLVVSVLFIPSFRAVARQIIYSFIFEPSNQLEVQVTLTNPDDLYNFTDPHNFPLSVQDAQVKAGFKVKQVSSLPDSLRLVGARFDPKYNSVTILYEGKDNQLFLTQRPLSHGADVFSVGSDAQVKLVMIGDIQGEFVIGGWKAISTERISPDSTPVSTVNISAVWDDNLPQSTLRWQTDGNVFELRSLGEGGYSESELIYLANGLK